MRTLSKFGPALALGLLTATTTAQLEPWITVGGRVAIDFTETNLSSAGLEIIELNETADGVGPDLEGMEGELVSFNVPLESEGLVALRNRWGQFQPYGVVGGSLGVDGGFMLHAPDTGAIVDFTRFVITPIDVRTDGPGGVRDPDYFYLHPADADPSEGFELYCVKAYFQDGEGYVDADGGDHDPIPEFRVKAWDMVVTPKLAAALGHPEWEELHVGQGKFQGEAFPYFGEWSHPNGQNIYTPYADGAAGDAAEGGGVVDVALGLMGGLVTSGRVGSFGSGRQGLSMSTTSCNFGTADVPWLSPGGFIGANIQENHPGIGMQLYREMDGRFAQVGVSWVKHGFFALSNSQCIPCQNPSNGTFLGVGCSDTYGSGNNSDRFYLGPRSEWNAFTAEWEGTCSYFDGANCDDRRSSLPSVDAVDHKLEAFDVDLGLPGADYYHEAMYLVIDETNLFNNIGSRAVGINNTGSSFSMNNFGSKVDGPAIYRWGEQHNTAKLPEGQVILAVDTTQIDANSWRYEYALFNWTLDRKVRSFSIPQGVAITDLYFHDIDAEAGNDWVSTNEAGNRIWEFPDVFLPGHKVAGPLEWGTLYNFGFTANAPPVTQDVVIGLHDPGAGGDFFSIETLGPRRLSMAAQPIAPAGGTSTTLKIRHGDDDALLLVTEVDGVALPAPALLTFTPIPFVGDTIDIPLSVPVSASGHSLTFIAATYDSFVTGLSNTVKVEAQ